MPSTTELLLFIESHYGLRGLLKPLPSYIDQNYLLITDSSEKFVVKISSPTTPVDEIMMENEAMNHMAGKSLSFETPAVITDHSDSQLLDYKDSQGRILKLRIVSFLDGELYSQVEASSHLHYSLGKLLAETVRALEDFEHDSAHRQFIWDVAQLNLLQNNLKYFKKDQHQALKDELEMFQETTSKALKLLPKQVIHNDANDNNLIVNQTDGEWVCSGLFDFGDMVFSARICELAVAMTYALMNQQNLFSAARNIISGYQSVTDISDEELQILPLLIRARLTQSLLNSGKSHAMDPDNEYLLLSVQPAWDLLNTMKSLSPAEFINQLRG